MSRITVLFILGLFAFTSQAQERRILTSDGVELYVKVQGKGTACLFIHGGPGSGSYFLEKLAGDYLEPNFKMIYLDQRGSGRSTSPKDLNYSMDRMIKDFEEVRIALGLKDWIILGHSFGGLLQMGYAELHPENIIGMIMINFTLNLKESYSSSWCPKACEFLNISDMSYYLNETIPIKMRWDSLIMQMVRKDIIWKMAFSSREDMNLMNSLCSEVPHGSYDFENIAFSINDYFKDYKRLSSSMKMPVLFFYGERDWMAGPEHYKGLHFPNMMLWKFNSGHMMPFLANKKDLEEAISSYREKYRL